jgi:hypothetical protein
MSQLFTTALFTLSTLRLLEGLAEAAQENAVFFKPALGPLAELMGAVGQNGVVPDGIRQVKAA